MYYKSLTVDRKSWYDLGASNEARYLRDERDRYKAALEDIMAEGSGACPPEGCGHPGCNYCVARKALLVL